MHRHVGEMLEKMTADPDEVAGQLATHFVEAGDHSRAWRYARGAGERSRAAYSYAEALDDYRARRHAAVRVDGVPPRESPTSSRRPATWPTWPAFPRVHRGLPSRP